MRWLLRNRTHQAETELPLPALLTEFFSLRNLNASAITSIMEPRLDLLSLPVHFQGMNLAVSRLIEAFKNQETIAVYGDFDLDGTCGMVMLTEGLQKLGFTNVLPVQPRRLKEGYGFHLSIAQDLLAQGASVIVTVDVGISAVDTVTWLQQQGVDVILTDHHLPGAELPPAFTIVNPNLADCYSECGYLSGTGVGFYLLRALKGAFVQDLGFAASCLNLKNFLDLFAIATISDMVPMVQDNWLLTRLGLIELARTQRPALAALLSELELYGVQILAEDVGIRIAPKLNALTRLDGEVRAQFLLWHKPPQDPAALVARAMSANEDRRDLQKEALAIASESLDLDNFQGAAICIQSERFHKGVIGLVAQELMKSKGVPSFVGVNIDGVIIGSSRAPQEDHVNLVETMRQVSELLIRFGGHEKAAGFEILESNWQAFAEGLEKAVRAGASATSERVSYVDLILQSHKEIRAMMEWWPRLTPFGKEYEAPVLAIPISLAQLVDLKGKHFQLRFGITGLRGVFFSPSDSERELLVSGKGYLIGQLQVNRYMGRSQLQFRASQCVAEILIQDQHILDASVVESSRQELSQ